MPSQPKIDLAKLRSQISCRADAGVSILYFDLLLKASWWQIISFSIFCEVFWSLKNKESNKVI